MNTENLSSGKRAVIHRARLISDFEWTPLNDVESYVKKGEKIKLLKGEKIKGIPYSSTEPTDKFIGENVSLETFRSIISNPDSALYCKNLGGHHNSWAYFGMVCNGFVRYALNINRRYSTKRWLDVPGMNKIADDGCYKVDEVEIGDVLYAYGKGRNHVVIVTDVVTDDEGKVTSIEVSEANRPKCLRKMYTPDEFYTEFNLFALCRYDYVDDVPEPCESDVFFATATQAEKLPAIAVDYGTKSNYRTCEEVVISVFGDGENKIEISKNGEAFDIITINGKGKTERKFPRGYYTAKLADTEQMVEFCVTEPVISHKVIDGKITITADPGDSCSKIQHLEFREKCKATEVLNLHGEKEFYNPVCSSLSKVEELTDEEKETGVFIRSIPEDAYNFKVYFKNPYGVWTHTMIEI